VGAVMNNFKKKRAENYTDNKTMLQDLYEN